MPTLPSRIQKIIHPIRKHIPAWVYVVLGLGFIITSQFLGLLIPKTVQLSYSGDTCVHQITLLPGWRKQSAGNQQYKVEYRDVTSWGEFDGVANITCFTPLVPPQPGTTSVSTALVGNWLSVKRYTIMALQAPFANVAAINAPVAATKALRFPMSASDTLFNYRLKIKGNYASCRSAEQSLECDINQLKLKQGASYDFELMRHYKQFSEASAGEGKLTTRKAVKITKQSLKQNQTVYAKPTKFTFTTNKTLTDVTASVLAVANKEKISVEAMLEKKSVHITLKEQLPRETTFQLILEHVEARDGSTLVEPLKRTFTTSGGPKVASVNIGSSSVAPRQNVILTFDQPIRSSVDVTKYVSLTGGTANVTRLSSTQVQVALGGLKRCKQFSINVKQGLASKHGVRQTNAWEKTARTRCYTTTTYGTSHQGRPLTAYIFGSSGPVTMYVGALHGNEPSSKYLMDAWIKELEANPARFAGKRIIVVPNANPDGVSAGTRTNARGVNLNRNFPTNNWVKDINDTDGRHKSGGGKKPLSEPEAKALASFTSSLAPRLLVSFHAIGSLVIGDPGTLSANKASQYASLVGYRNATGGSAPFDYSITGAFEEWSYQKVGIPSMVIELDSYSSYALQRHKAALWAMIR